MGASPSLIIQCDISRKDRPFFYRLKIKEMNPTIEKALTNFLQHFEPAYKVEESDEQLSTSDIFNRFWNLTGDPELTLNLIHTILTERGFVYDYVLDEFRWLLKIK